MRRKIKLGILDFCWCRGSKKPVDSIWETIAAASTAEKLGFSRFWVGEHHTSDVAHSSPELLAPILCAATHNIKIGVNLLLRYRSPFKVATDARLLQSVFPDRLEIGLARGEVDPIVKQLLLGAADETPYEPRVYELIALLQGRGKTSVNPRGIAPPAVWMLGTGGRSAQVAAECGIPFCLGLFLDSDLTSSAEVIDSYRSCFVAREPHARPSWMIAVAGVCAETADEAHSIAATASGGIRPRLVGSPSQCYDILASLQDRFFASEFLLLDLSNSLENRERSYRLLASTLWSQGRNSVARRS